MQLEDKRKSWVKLTNLVLANLVLWMELLRRANGLALWMELLRRVNIRIFMNFILTHMPTIIICWSDLCPFGFRGSLLQSGWASMLNGRSILINYFLKFIGMAVNVWLECPEVDIHKCILSISDNTSHASGWLAA